MRTGRVIAAGLCFLAVAAPNISTAQSPKAKAANAVVGVVKQTSRLKWSTSQGFYFDPVVAPERSDTVRVFRELQ
jgi:hypothetical protein